MARQFTTRSTVLWIAIGALWLSATTLNPLLRFIDTRSYQPDWTERLAMRLLPAIVLVPVFLGLTAGLRWPFRRLSRPWATAALTVGLVAHLVLSAPLWLLDLLPG